MSKTVHISKTTKERLQATTPQGKAVEELLDFYDAHHKECPGCGLIDRCECDISSL